MSFRTTVCPDCQIRLDSKAMVKHTGSKVCKDRQISNEAADLQWSVIPHDLSRVLKSQWFQDRVKVVRSLDEVGVRLKYNTPPQNAWWVESWFMDYYKALYAIAKDRTVVLNMMYEPIFSTDDTETRISILEMILGQAKRLYGVDHE